MRVDHHHIGGGAFRLVEQIDARRPALGKLHGAFKQPVLHRVEALDQNLQRGAGRRRGRNIGCRRDCCLFRRQERSFDWFSMGCAPAHS